MVTTLLLKTKTIDHKPDITSLISPEFAQIDYPWASPFKITIAIYCEFICLGHNKGQISLNETSYDIDIDECMYIY